MIQKLFISFLLATFGLFLSSPVFAAGETGDDIMILSASYSDICRTNITCEKTQEGTYTCSDTPETIAAQGIVVHQISSGKGASLFLPNTGGGIDFSDDIYRSCGIVRAQEENYVYPFVRITKIQV